jgi:hypothetical protein
MSLEFDEGLICTRNKVVTIYIYKFTVTVYYDLIK